MPRIRGWWWKLLLLPACIAYQVLVHFVLADGSATEVRLTLAAIPILALGLWIVKRARKKLLWTAALATAAVGVYLVEQQQHLGLAATNALTHAAINLCLLWVFGRTLVGGREPLITGFARRFHGTIPPHIEAYTRGVTWLWCVFFLAQVAMSALLAAFAPLALWSFFVNVLSTPLVVLTFVAEYAYRSVRFRRYPHASLLKGMQLFVDDARRERGRSAVS